MIAIMLSIHDRHANNILDGLKTMELRKTVPQHFNQYDESTMKVYLYVTGTGTVVGECSLDAISELSPDPAVWKSEKACVTDIEYVEYANGKPLVGWEVSNGKRYVAPIKLSNFGLKRAPQSWCYVDVAS